jgi:hypothetical protein
MAYLKSPHHDRESTLFWTFLIASLILLIWCFSVADDEKYVRYFALAFTICGLLISSILSFDGRPQNAAQARRY